MLDLCTCMLDTCMLDLCTCMLDTCMLDLCTCMLDLCTCMLDLCTCMLDLCTCMLDLCTCIYTYVHDSVICKHIFLIQGPDIIIHQPDDILEGMNEWCIDHHGQVQFFAALHYFPYNTAVHMLCTRIHPLQGHRSHQNIGGGANIIELSWRSGGALS